MLIILFILVLIRSLHGVPLALSSEPPDSFTAFDVRDTQGHLGQRSINDIVISCFATIFACTWSAIHPNIPAVTDSSWTRFKRQLTTMICALVAPELLTFWAMRQRVAAKKIMDEYNKAINNLEPKPKRSFFDALRKRFQAAATAIPALFQDLPLPPALEEGKGPQWTLAHGFFLQMGGLMVCKKGIPSHILTEDIEAHKETGIIYNIENNILDPPRIAEEDIKDRSKGDTISKTFIILQTTWFIVQCIARWSQRLPVTELEVVTLGFAMLNGITYGLWWHKPQNVGRPVFLESRKPNSSHDTSTADNGASDAESESNPLLQQADPQKQSWLRRKLRQEMEEHARSPTLLWRIPYRILVGFARPVYKMLNDSTVEETRVGIFYTANPDSGREAGYAIAAIGTLLGVVHLLPSWFLDFSSGPERWLWRVSAIIITVVPMLALGIWFIDVGYETLGMIFAFSTAIGIVIYPIARITLLTLSLTSLHLLAPAALQTIEWTTFIPHL